jgi:hypothetical protein
MADLETVVQTLEARTAQFDAALRRATVIQEVAGSAALLALRRPLCPDLPRLGCWPVRPILARAPFNAALLRISSPATIFTLLSLVSASSWRSSSATRALQYWMSSAVADMAG